MGGLLTFKVDLSLGGGWGGLITFGVEPIQLMKQCLEKQKKKNV